jgi:hypothetical protein
MALIYDSLTGEIPLTSHNNTEQRALETGQENASFARNPNITN